MATHIALHEGTVLQDGVLIGRISDNGEVSHCVPIAPATKGRIKGVIMAAGMGFSGFVRVADDEALAGASVAMVSDEPEPAQDPYLGDRTPEWMAWRERAVAAVR